MVINPTSHAAVLGEAWRRPITPAIVSGGNAVSAVGESVVVVLWVGSSVSVLVPALLDLSLDVDVEVLCIGIGTGTVSGGGGADVDLNSSLVMIANRQLVGSSRMRGWLKVSWTCARDVKGP